MEKKRRIYLFHLSRKDGRAFFLDPFHASVDLIPLLENTEIISLYGREPRVEEITHLRNDLYRRVEAAVKNWVAEQRFIPRFLASSGVFLFTYLFLSLAVRDPLPMIDELLIALGVALALYFYLARRDLSSTGSSKKRADLRSKIDSIYFAEDEFVKEVEKNLHRVETESPQQVLESLIASTDSFYTHLNAEAAAQLARYLEVRLGSRELKRQERRLKEFSRGRRESAGKDLESLSRQFSNRKIDLSLFALYHGIKQDSGKSS